MTGKQITMLLLVVSLALSTSAAASAEQDPCDACIAEWSWAECPCLPLAPEPPISSLACIPAR